MIAVAFVMMIGTILAALAAMVTSGVGNRAALEAVRDRQYAADGAVEQVIAATRADVDDGTVTCGDRSATIVTVDEIRIRVDRQIICGATLGGDGLPVTQLNLVATACEDTGAACADDAVVVRALVGFELGAGGTVTHVPVHSWSVNR